MQAAGLTNAANYPKAAQVAGSLTKLGAAAGVVPVAVKVADGKSLTVGDGLAIAASAAALFGPVGGAVAVALTIAGVGYAIYEANNGEIKLKDLIPDVNADPSNIPHDPPSNWNDVAPDNQNHPNNEKNWCDPSDWRDWQNSLNRDGKYHVYDPLVLDLDGDGIETVGTQGYKGALFDHNSDGIRTATGWVSSDDGLLVIDRNGDGVINDGSELFGDSYTLSNGTKAEHGYAALAEFDTNGDGKVDANDKDFDKLKVWRDLNQDGISQEGELFTLAEVGVASLSVAYQDVNTRLGNGNTIAQKGSYTTANGETREMGDLLLAADHLHSRYIDSVQLTDEQMQAANVQGIGRLRDLREVA
ncbi:hypothetical protein EGK75_05585 [Neisseria weixii]|uniref:Calcium-binding protein n=1 Tax=Neisseria weixii TaxID=1853276 RepID=A0A3N4N7Y1_9NEIS|nr:hypothetical protein EGK74_05945 [Neisseria weixii]RPD89069.1 hypothetical protein EGK75_05585 [Neisseria weixii]